ncbi:hypothetical protein [Demequina sp. NBRC 110055]|uniref:hypothetical protein n=1 Tax=Demequina sp. NBRC 110055 TaxID=1570344 RepID=UPI000A0264D0|nr:hypothetical protein [Demequina sp. NBRC 110055]
MRARVTASAVTALVVSAGTLTGCSSEGIGGAVGEIARDSAQQAVEDATGGDVSLNFGEGATLPSDWPTAVPVPEGELSAAAVTGSGWTVATTGPSLEMTDYAAALEEAGFTESRGGSVADAASGARYSDGDYRVDIAWAGEPGGDTGLLTVVVAGASVDPSASPSA